jgi:hypothetical protein
VLYFTVRICTARSSSVSYMYKLLLTLFMVSLKMLMPLGTENHVLSYLSRGVRWWQRGENDGLCSFGYADRYSWASYRLPSVFSQTVVWKKRSNFSYETPASISTHTCGFPVCKVHL